MNVRSNKNAAGANDGTLARARRWVRPEIQALTAYHVPDAAGLVKLDAMENPFRWPEALASEWLDIVARVPLNRYPDPAANALKHRLREVFAVPDTAQLILGNGSDELIQMLALALAPGPVIAPGPSFVMYRMIATITGCRFVEVPLAPGFDLDPDNMLSAIRRHEPALVFLAYPNNPTGNLFARDEIEALIDATPGVVVVDEAYHAFARHTWLDSLDRYENLLVMRTLSKLGFAGLRLGFLAGPPAWVDELEKVRLPYNVNSLTQATADFALSHGSVFEEQAARITGERDKVARELASLPGIEVYPSAANFLLFRTQRSADQVYQGLLREGVLIKRFIDPGGPLAGHLRVTIGTPDENDAFLGALRRVTAA